MTETVSVPIATLQRLRAAHVSTMPNGRILVEKEAYREVLDFLPNPPKVGDTLTAEQIKMLPQRSIVLDRDNDPWIVGYGGDVIYYTDDDTQTAAYLANTYGPVTLALLGKPRD